MENLFDMVFEKKCYFCGTSGKSVCYSCLYKLHTEEQSICVVCQGLAVEGYTHEKCKGDYTPERFISVFTYEGSTAKIIKMSKYDSKLFSTLKDLAYEGARMLERYGVYLDDFALCAVPLSASRLKERGFNQSQIIADELRRFFKLSPTVPLLWRTAHTGKQFGLGVGARKENLGDVFQASPLVKASKVLLIDDICTSGSTFLSASKALYEAGAKTVWCFSLTRTPRHSQNT